MSKPPSTNEFDLATFIKNRDEEEQKKNKDDLKLNPEDDSESVTNEEDSVWENVDSEEEVEDDLMFKMDDLEQPNSVTTTKEIPPIPVHKTLKPSATK